jgi:hypothetical protein
MFCFGELAKAELCRLRLLAEHAQLWLLMRLSALQAIDCIYSSIRPGQQLHQKGVSATTSPRAAEHPIVLPELFS